MPHTTTHTHNAHALPPSHTTSSLTPYTQKAKDILLAQAAPPPHQVSKLPIVRRTPSAVAQSDWEKDQIDKQGPHRHL